jgi:hypothetical protein
MHTKFFRKQKGKGKEGTNGSSRRGDVDWIRLAGEGVVVYTCEHSPQREFTSSHSSVNI